MTVRAWIARTGNYRIRLNEAFQRGVIHPGFVILKHKITSPYPLLKERVAPSPLGEGWDEGNQRHGGQTLASERSGNPEAFSGPGGVPQGDANTGANGDYYIAIILSTKDILLTSLNPKRLHWQADQQH